jgi:hypothetical protein
VDTIANNRTALATYTTKFLLQHRRRSKVVVIGAGAGVGAGIRSWVLEAANNRGPQPEASRPGVV